MKQYVIKRIPNSPRGEQARALLKLTSEFTYKTHGRGHRFGGGPYGCRWGMKGCGGYYQELPLPMAAWWTLYGYPKGGYQQEGDYEKQYFEFRGWKNDKPVIRTRTQP